MESSLQRRCFLQAAAAFGAAGALPAARACDFMTSTLRVTHPWTRSTAADASWAVLCMKFDEVNEADRLILVETPIASGAEMGGIGAGPAVNFAIPQGQETYLHEGGTFVRLVGLKHALEVGRSYPLRLGFEKGGRHDTAITVDYLRFK